MYQAGRRYLFLLSVCKNYNAGAAAGGVSGQLQIPDLIFLIVKIVIREQQLWVFQQ